MKASKILCLLTLLGFFFAPFSYSQNPPKKIGIFINGSFDPPRPDNTRTGMDQLVDLHISDLQSAMEEKGYVTRGDETSIVVDSLHELKNALEPENLKCRCGDTLTIFFVGHGRGWLLSEEKAKADKENKDLYPRLLFAKENKTIEANVLRELIAKGVGNECCCKVNVVVFACSYDHKEGTYKYEELEPSGWIKELMKDPHVISVYVSTSHGLLSWSWSWMDERNQSQSIPDWVDRFVGALDENRGNATAITDALGQAASEAGRNIPMVELGIQKPSGWQKGEFTIVAHIEGSIQKDQNGKRYLPVTFLKPEFIRGVSGTSFENRNRLYVGDQNVNSLKFCDWITCKASFANIDEPISLTGEITLMDHPPKVRIIGHVEGMEGNVIVVSPIEPNWLIRGTGRIKKKPRIGGGGIDFVNQFMYSKKARKRYIYIRVQGQEGSGKLKHCQWIDDSLTAEVPNEYKTQNSQNKRWFTKVVENQTDRIEPSEVILRGVCIRFRMNNEGGMERNKITGELVVRTPTITIEGVRTPAIWLKNKNDFLKKGKKSKVEIEITSEIRDRIFGLSENNKNRVGEAVVDIQVYYDEDGNTRYRVTDETFSIFRTYPATNWRLGPKTGALFNSPQGFDQYHMGTMAALEEQIYSSPPLITLFNSEILLLSDPVDYKIRPSFVYGITGSYRLFDHWEASAFLDFYRVKVESKIPYQVLMTGTMMEGTVTSGIQTTRWGFGMDRFWFNEVQPFAGAGFCMSHFNTKETDADLQGVVFPIGIESRQHTPGFYLNGGLRYNVRDCFAVSGGLSLFGQRMRLGEDDHRLTISPQLGLNALVKF